MLILTSTRFWICATLFSTALRVLPSVTISVESLVITTFVAEPSTSLPAFSRVKPISSLITVPVNHMNGQSMELKKKKEKEKKEEKKGMLDCQTMP